MAFLMNELHMNADRGTLKKILERSIPVTPQDVVLIFCTVSGWNDGSFIQITDARKIYHGDFMGESCSGIQITTAASLCAVVDLHREGKLPSQGFVRQEQVELPTFLENRFGKVYSTNDKALAFKLAPPKAKV